MDWKSVAATIAARGPGVTGSTGNLDSYLALVAPRGHGYPVIAVRLVDFSYDEMNGGATCNLCGHLTTQSRLDLQTGGSVKTMTQYNLQGMPISSTDPNQNATTYVYDGTGIFPGTVTQPTTSNGVAHIDHYTWDANTGNKLSHTDQNNVVTSYSYSDPLGRLTLIDSAVGGKDAGGISAESYATYSYPSAIEVDVAQDQISTGDGALKSSTVYDGLGRAIKTAAADGSVIETAYDGLDRRCAVSNPTYSDPGPLSCTATQNPAQTGTDGITYFAYDALGREKLQTQSDGSAQRWIYTGNTVDFYDEDQDHWQRTSDALGRLTKVLENDPAGSGTLSLETDYGYDALNNLTSVSQLGGSGDTSRTRGFGYDSLSRLTSANNPESGAVNYTYVNTGGSFCSGDPSKVCTRTDARGIVTSYSYDTLNRLVGKNYVNEPANAPTPTLSISYDTEIPWQLVNYENHPVGHVNQIVTTLGTTLLDTWLSNDYDERGQLMGYSDCIGSTAQNCQSAPGVNGVYDFNLDESFRDWAMNACGSVCDSAAEFVNYSYDNAARLASLTTTLYLDPSENNIASTIFSSPTYYAGGTLKSANLAVDPESQQPAITLSRSLNDRGWITGESDTSGQQQPVYNYSLGYDVNGNVTGYTDSVMGAWNTGYDLLHRLTSDAATSGTYAGVTFNYIYDNFGNRKQQTLYYGGAPVQSTPYLNFTSGTNRVDGWSYDASGNLLDDGVNRYLYDGEGRLCAVDQYYLGGGLTGYFYSPDGSRLAKGTITSFSCDSRVNGLTLTNVYVRGPHGEQAEETDGNFNTLSLNVFLGSNLLATYTGTSYLQSNWHYALNDWVGTKRVVANNDGTISASFASGAFGDATPPPGLGGNSDTILFTGKDRDTESNLDYFGARYYNSNMGRFMSPDFWGDDDGPPDPTPYGDLSNPQSLNLYSYVGNNPLSRVDADGHDCIYLNSDNTLQGVLSGDCASDTDNGIYVNGTINTVNENSQGQVTGYSGTAYDSGNLLSGSFATPLPADNPGLDMSSAQNAQGVQMLAGAYNVVNMAGTAELNAGGFAFPFEHLAVTLLAGSSPSGVQQASGGLRRKPGSLGQFGDNARENKFARDIAKRLGLNTEEGAAEVHQFLQEGNAYAGRQLSFKEALDYVGKALGLIE